MCGESVKPVFYSKTARGHIVFYGFPIEVLEDRIGTEKWIKIKENTYKIEFLRGGAVFTVKFAEYPDYIFVISLHKTTSKKKIKELRRRLMESRGENCG